MSERDEAFPFEGTEATRMLREGLRRAADERGLSTRGAARELGYKATVVISHMSTGRVPIPLERAAEIAEVVGLDENAFYLAVLEQRYPGSAQILGLDRLGKGGVNEFCHELELIASCSLTDLSTEHKAVIREVVSERNPARRWLSLAELPVMMTLRDCRPDLSRTGMSPGDLDRLAHLVGRT